MMTDLEQPAPSERELDEALADASREFGRLADKDLTTSRLTNLFIAHQLEWLRTALPGLLATARDGEREPVEWLVRHVEPSLRKPLSFKSREEAEGYARWYNAQTSNFRAEVCAVIPLAAARSTGSVDNG